MDKVTIVIPSYNSAQWVAESLNSILLSTTKEFEVIVVDDGSTDNTKDIIEPFLKDDRINYIFQNNKGLSGARNTGIKNAKGEFLVFLDSDDLILPEKLSVQCKYLKDHPEVDIVYSNSQWFVEDDFNETLPVQFPIYEGDVLNQLIYGNFMHVNSVMVRKGKVIEAGLFDELLRELEDWDLWLRIVLNGSKIGFTPGILSKVRIRKGSMTSNQKKMNSTMVRVLQKIIQGINPNHSIQIKAHHSLLIYLLKSDDTKGYLNSIYKYQIRFGYKFFPIAVKQIIKFVFKRWIKQNHTTAEIENIWKTN